MDEKTLRIYFTSDIHAFFYPTDYRSHGEKNIGLFKCANRFEKDGNTLVIDGGDILQGSPLGAFCHDSVGNPEKIAEIMNFCGYDYVTLGNHDFNYGTEYLEKYLNTLNADCICQNAENKQGESKYPYCIHTLENGLKIGVVGIVTDYVNVWERPEHLEGVNITSPLSAAKKALEEIRDRCDLTVCVYHGGFERDLDTGAVLSTSTENVAYQICSELDYDILLTGHQHMSVKGRKLFDTFIVQPSDSGREFVRLDVKISGGKKQISSVTCPAEGQCDESLMNMFSELNQGAEKWLDMEVGHLSQELMPGDHLEMAFKGSGLADFFNMVQLSASGADISAASLANEVAGLPKTVRRRDVLTAYPYPNTLAVVKMSGKHLKEVVERSAEYFALDEGGNVHISEGFLKPKVEHYNYDYYAGFDYSIDLKRPAGQRVTELKYKGKDIKDDDFFNICVNNYRACGAGGYPQYSSCELVREINTEMSELILNYFKENPSVTVEPVNNMHIFC